MKRLIALSTMIMIVAISAFADVARPDKPSKPLPKPKSINSKLFIDTNENLQIATLYIPRSQLKKLTAEFERSGDDEENTASVSHGSRFQTVVAGAFLSIALILGGFWFARGGKLSASAGKVVGIIAMAAGLGSAASLVNANVGPPLLSTINSKIFNSKAFDGPLGLTGNIKVVTTDDSEFHLAVPGKFDEEK